MAGDHTRGILGQARAVCPVCPHQCSLAEGQYWRCRARVNRGGKIVCANYGKLTALALDPIEKKPLRRFFPGNRILSVGSFGCNLSCPFCQNHEIAMGEQGQVPYGERSPEELASLACRCRAYGNLGVAYTYNEPLVGYEYVRDTARLVHGYGMKNVLVTNGFANLSILEELLPVIDAMNIDLKGFTDAYYLTLGAELETVKQFIQRAALDCHVELTTLIVPGENDTEEEMEREAQWIASISPRIPLHVTRFFPRYCMREKNATNIEVIKRLSKAASRYLAHVYTGNC